MTEKHFTFEHDGGEYTFEKLFSEVLRPGFIRKNRRRDELDFVFTILEEIAGEEALDAVDDMSTQQFADFGKAFRAAMSEAMGATLGE